MKLYVFHCDDGSISFEWIDKDFRFGISLEKDKEESSWYFVHRGAIAEGDVLPDELLNYLVYPVELVGDGLDLRAYATANALPALVVPTFPGTVTP